MEVFHMTEYRSLEQALTDLANIIVPLGQELGGLTPSAPALALVLAGPITSLFSIIVLNIIGLTFLRCGIKTSLHMLRCAAQYLSFVTRPTPKNTLRSQRHEVRHSIAVKRGMGYHARRPRASETSSGFESWEDFSKRCKTEELTGDTTSQIVHPCAVLEVSHLVTEPEIRSTYMRLMTMYHPDRPLQEAESGGEELENAPVHVQQTYETLTGRLYRTP
jgi:hypothetical protein